MLRFVLGRVATGVLLVFSVCTIVFLATALIPRHPEVNLLGPAATPEAIATVRASFGLDQPLVVQYFSWLVNAVQGDFGNSWSTSQAVLPQLSVGVGRPLSLVLVAFLLAMVVGVGLGLLSALKPNGLFDRVVSVITAALQAIPEFWLALLFITAFAVMLPLFPASGYVEITASFSGWLTSIALPAAALGLPVGASISRHARSAVIRELSNDYVRAAVARGFPRSWILGRRVLRNSLPSLATILGLQALILISVSVIVESVFAIRGLGTLLLNAVSEQDTPMLLGAVAVFTVLVVSISVLTDIARALLDPRTRV